MKTLTNGLKQLFWLVGGMITGTMGPIFIIMDNTVIKPRAAILCGVIIIWTGLAMAQLLGPYVFKENNDE